MASGYRGSVVDSVQRLFGQGTVTALSEAQLLERYLARQDETAFEAILQRHGPMVLGVCRRVLDDPHDVDDAFQATFLVLVRRAGSIRNRDVLATWLHGVARRVAVRARVNARRRRACEQSRGEAATGRSNALGTDQDRVEADEIRSLIDLELGRLPVRYRTALVLCDLEGQTHEQAAEALRCPVGTVKSRLARGRERLRDRLVRRGIAPAAGLGLLAVGSGSASAAAPSVPEALVRLTIQAAAGTFPAGVAALLRGVLASMWISKLKLAALGLVVLVLGLTGAWTVLDQAPAQPAPPAGGTVSEAKVDRFTLDNGLKVILRPIRAEGQAETALIVLYAIGSDHDPAGQSGLGQMVANLYLTAAAGEEKSRTLDQLARRYPQGANGQVGDRYTAFSAMFPAKDLDAELHDAAARMSVPRVTDADLDRARRNLLQQISSVFGSVPALAAQNHARERIRPTPRGGRRLGQPAQVRALTLETVQTYWQRYYKPRNAILVLAGAIDPAAARTAIQAHFGPLAPGELAAAPGEPGTPQYGATPAVTAKPFDPAAKSSAALAYLAPQPGTDVYAPFLVLASRLWAAADHLGGGAGESGTMPVYFTPLDDGAIVAVSSPARKGETPAQSYARLEAFVAETIEPKLGNQELAATAQRIGFLMGTVPFPDNILARNPYGVAFSLGRREQLGIDSARLGRALEAVTEAELRRVARQVFDPARCARTFVAVEK
jgi:zinc protease